MDRSYPLASTDAPAQRINAVGNGYVEAPQQTYEVASGVQRGATRINAPLSSAEPQLVADPNHLRLALGYAEQAHPREYRREPAAFEKVLQEFCKNHRQEIDSEIKANYVTSFTDITSQVARFINC